MRVDGRTGDGVDALALAGHVSEVLRDHPVHHHDGDHGDSEPGRGDDDGDERAKDEEEGHGEHAELGGQVEVGVVHGLGGGDAGADEEQQPDHGDDRGRDANAGEDAHVPADGEKGVGGVRGPEGHPEVAGEHADLVDQRDEDKPGAEEPPEAAAARAQPLRVEAQLHGALLFLLRLGEARVAVRGLGRLDNRLGGGLAIGRARRGGVAGFCSLGARIAVGNGRDRRRRGGSCCSVGRLGRGGTLLFGRRSL